MTRRYGTVLAFLFLALLFAGCGGFKGYVADYLAIGREMGLSEGYLDTLGKWTREKTGYSQFETRFYLAVTYRSADMNRAFLMEQARVLQLTEEELKGKRRLQEETDREFTTFFLYAYTDDRLANDFAERGSMWRIYLVDDQGKKHAPLEVRKVDRVTPEIEAFYPYVNRHFGSCYNLKFPRQGRDDLKLVFTSVLGEATLSWGNVK
ncbi:MAG TPA: hypothetical protein PK836_07945 [Syntrophales bacterium]|nr:hypothetical protein [Syntrophales bacterium]HOM06676.1 hypothetical protein [Syntrophales bacterium]HOO00136.1 hypothetical protein [Syntrophales bacterium]HPC01598.1 hypothetical protein [Syntrophales bacterium]HPQ06337.1 hypothetical protein [Syntrophales bacterium]